ncbi:MAG TPA: SDR family NAD(P)-dependent oxidoreductase [Chloroflexota bacterium]|nr:SDR family NAD(P)-dependent oxidoreductase [Chloroflexota bacterium]
MAITIDLSGQVAIVTGAAGGLGQASAVRLAEAGAALLLVDRDLSGLTKTAALINANGTPVRMLAGDVTDSAFPEAIVQSALVLGGQIDMLVNAAGILRTSKVIELSDEDWQQVMDVNATAVMRVSRAVSRAMVDVKRGGRIVNFASLSAHQAHENSAAYCASKAAVLLLTKTMATELGPSGIRVNAVSPGWVDTPMTKPWQEENRRVVELVAQQIPAGRLGTPWDIAEVVVFLCSPLAGYVNGTTILIDGGFTAHYSLSLPD